MILLTFGADALVRLMREDRHGPDTAWLMFGPGRPAAETDEAESDWPLAAE